VLILLAKIPTMFLRNLSAALMGCALLAAPAAAIREGARRLLRMPSTMIQRAKVSHVGRGQLALFVVGLTLALLRSSHIL
jgi:hypothetical protein